MCYLPRDKGLTPLVNCLQGAVRSVGRSSSGGIIPRQATSVTFVANSVPVPLFLFTRFGFFHNLAPMLGRAALIGDNPTLLQQLAG
jgi:hypothetical protein